MTNKEIIILANGGFLSATAHTLPLEHFYKFHRFKRAVERANRTLGEAQTALLQDCGIDPSRLAEADEDARARFHAANTALLNEDAAVEVKARIPFEFYKELYDENKTAARDIFANADVEAVVLDNLFSEIEE